MNKAAGWIIAGMLTLSVTSFSIALQANHLAEKSAYFNDRGTFYNWFDFVDVKETVPGVFSLKFKNEQEFYYNHFVVTSAGVVVFDPLSDSAAEAMVDVIREKHRASRWLLLCIPTCIRTISLVPGCCVKRLVQILRSSPINVPDGISVSGRCRLLICPPRSWETKVKPISSAIPRFSCSIWGCTHRLHPGAGAA